MTPLSPFGLRRIVLSLQQHLIRSSALMFTSRRRRREGGGGKGLMMRRKKQKKANVMEPACSIYLFAWTIKAINQSNSWEQTSSHARLPRQKKKKRNFETVGPSFFIYLFFFVSFLFIHCFPWPYKEIRFLQPDFSQLLTRSGSVDSSQSIPPY